MADKAFQSIIIDKLHNENKEWDQTKQKIERSFYCKIPDTLVIHYDQLSIVEIVMLEEAMAAMLAVYVHNRQRKAAGGN